MIEINPVFYRINVVNIVSEYIIKVTNVFQNCTAWNTAIRILFNVYEVREIRIGTRLKVFHNVYM